MPNLSQVILQSCRTSARSRLHIHAKLPKDLHGRVLCNYVLLCVLIFSPFCNPGCHHAHSLAQTLREKEAALQEFVRTSSASASATVQQLEDARSAQAALQEQFAKLEASQVQSKLSSGP